MAIALECIDFIVPIAVIRQALARPFVRFAQRRMTLQNEPQFRFQGEEWILAATMGRYRTQGNRVFRGRMPHASHATFS